jgi:SAM-dependent methyltransferase
MPAPDRWNHNSHYHRVVLRAVPDAARSALDVGFGDGDLVRALAARVKRVVGVDADVGVVQRARAAGVDASGDVTVVRADVMRTRFPDEPFDVVSCIAVLHHLPLEAGLERLRDLTARGGVLVIVGLANDGGAWDRIVSAAGLPASWLARMLRGDFEHGSPISDPRESYGEVRAAAKRILPGVKYRRRLYWRYTLVWRRPS